MTTYTAIPDTSIDTDSPLTEELFTLLRDNPLAIVEGNATGSGVYVEKASFASDVGTWDAIETITIAASGHGANVLFDHVDNSNYNTFLIAGYSKGSTAGGRSVMIQTGNGGSYDAAGYSYVAQGVYEISTRVEWQSSSDTGVLIVEASTSDGFSGTSDPISMGIMITNASDTAGTAFNFWSGMGAGSNDMNATSGSGYREENAAHDIFRLVIGSGEWQSGSFTIYGMRNS